MSTLQATSSQSQHSTSEQTRVISAPTYKDKVTQSLNVQHLKEEIRRQNEELDHILSTKSRASKKINDLTIASKEAIQLAQKVMGLTAALLLSNGNHPTEQIQSLEKNALSANELIHSYHKKFVEEFREQVDDLTSELKDTQDSSSFGLTGLK